MWRLILMISSYWILGIHCDSPIVTLPTGKIEGLISKTYRNEKTFYAFMGIPFAAPPVGTLRFKPPQQSENWEGVLQTKSLPKMCYNVQKELPRQDEDCLYLNVFSPVKPYSNASLPVIVNIYGGAFVHGSATSDIKRPQNFLEQDILVVDFNYRVGPFGFLSTGDEVISGNMGLKDQQFALKWVQTNIHLFGGDPGKVTIMGQSAGGASVTYHILSPGSAGLFRAAIAQSSSALCSFAHQDNGVEIAYGIAGLIDPSFDKNRTSQELLDFLQSVDVKEITKTADKYHVFAPTIEVEQPDAFITEPMFESVKYGNLNRVPLLIGFCSEEEIKHLNDLSIWRHFVGKTYQNDESLVPSSMNIMDKTMLLEVGEKIKRIYSNQTHLVDDLGRALQMLSDNQYIRPVIKFAELLSQYSDVFLYQFSYQGAISNNHIDFEGVSGVGHSEDMKYLWTYFTDLDSFPLSDVQTVDRYVGLSTNFVKYLNPTPIAEDLFGNITFPRLTKNEIHYVDIRKELMVKKHPREFSYEKWNELFDAYANEPLIIF
nr:esterase [Phaedon brassicae]